MDPETFGFYLGDDFRNMFIQHLLLDSGTCSRQSQAQFHTFSVKVEFALRSSRQRFTVALAAWYVLHFNNSPGYGFLVSSRPVAVGEVARWCARYLSIGEKTHFWMCQTRCSCLASFSAPKVVRWCRPSSTTSSRGSEEIASKFHLDRDDTLATLSLEETSRWKRDALGRDLLGDHGPANNGGKGGRFDKCTPKVGNVVVSGWREVEVGGG